MEVTNELLIFFSSSASSTSSIVPPPPPLAAIIPSHHYLHQHIEEEIIELNDIPPPRELDLSIIPKPSALKLEEIRMPPEGSKIKIPKSKAELIELVTINGDGYEEILVTKCNKDEFDSVLR